VFAIATNVVFQLDLTTRLSRVVSGGGIGTGPVFVDAAEVAVDARGVLVVGDNGLGAARILRVDPATGARATVSDAVTGIGPPLQAPLNVTVASDGTIYVGGPESIQRVDPVTGDRAIVSGSGIGTGPDVFFIKGIVAEVDGTVVYTGGHNVISGTHLVRADVETGNRTVLFEFTGWSTVRPRYGDLTTDDSDGSLFFVDRGRTFCVCIYYECLVCVEQAAAIQRLGPGERARRVSGGAIRFSTTGEPTPYFGGKGRGPRLTAPRAVAMESSESLLVADGTRVLRVNVATGRRRLAMDLSVAAALPGGSDESIPYRYRPANVRSWLRRALRDLYPAVSRKSPDRLLDGLDPHTRRELNRRLYLAAWRTMHDILGASAAQDGIEAFPELGSTSARMGLSSSGRH
jgi:hypothetical protein